MGIYLNPDNTLFKKAVERDIYVDKSALIEKLWNDSIARNEFICFSRPRRFGKSTDANMISAYFSKGCDSGALFKELKISGWSSYQEHLNKHHVILLNMQDFLSGTGDIQDMISFIYEELSAELEAEFGAASGRQNLSQLLNRCHAKSGEGFIFIIDEWDCIFRDYKNDTASHNKYLDYLRLLLKDKPYVQMVYMTGILPIRKYGTHSALNMFDEISMVDAKSYSAFMGFTETEVKKLCEKYGADYEQMKFWYDGYCMRDGMSAYSPRSVTASIGNRDFSNYWSQTETFDALRTYIDLNYDGLKDAVIELLMGNRVKIDFSSFQNDMTTFGSKDDIFTLLTYLGYLGFLYGENEIYIPNNEVKDVFITSIKNSDWNYVTVLFQNANDLLRATWNMQCERVAAYIEGCHYENSILQYNDENALSYTVSLAYITAKQYYTIVRELPTGRGYADVVFLPRTGVDRPAMIVELKWNQDADTGIRQIKSKKYFLGLEDYLDRLLLVGISYDKNTKKHSCVIELYKDEVVD